MSQKENPYEYLLLEDDTIDIRAQVEKYSYHYKWFVVGVVIALFGAYTYLRYTPRQYEVAATILIDDERSSGFSSELAAFEEIGLMGGGKKVLNNEIGLLKSRSLMQRVVKELNLNVSYNTEGRFGEVAFYRNNLPFKITFFNKDSLFYQRDTTFKVQVLSATHFKLSDIDDEFTEEYSFGSNVNTAFGEFTITPMNVNSKNTELEYYVRIAPLKPVAKSLRNAVQVEFLFEKSTILELKLKGPIKLRSQDVLNELIRQYNKDAVEYKSLIGMSTNTFINERLEVIEIELKKVDSNVEVFKMSNKLSDISTEASLVLENNSELEKRIIDLNTQLKLVAYVTGYMDENSNQLLPANLGLTDTGINSNTARYNEVLMERNRIAKSSGKKNPIIINLNTQLTQLRASISQGLVNHESSLNITLEEAMVQEQRLSSRITAAPRQEREYRDIQRRQQIIETLYLFLLEKREENAISLAVTVPNSKLIDAADGSNIPISPKRKIVYLVAILIGLIVPFAIIYILFLLDNKVHTRKDIEVVVKAPLLGNVPKSKTENKVLLDDYRSGLAEAFRMLRTNLRFFMLSHKKEELKVIFVTSTIANEGKTFIAINLAAVMALSNKKVLLVGADIRKPKVAEYLNKPVLEKGLSMFLIDDSIQVTDIIEHVAESNFDIIQSGLVAPNPSELLMNGRFDAIMDYGKKHYDYVFVDTSPINMVTDTLQLAHHADFFLYVVRANYLDKRLLEVPQQLYTEKRLPNMAIIVNGSDASKGYGYGYGYGYEQETNKKKWWKFGT